MNPIADILFCSRTLLTKVTKEAKTGALAEVP
jgi:hypothetical protein